MSEYDQIWEGEHFVLAKLPTLFRHIIVMKLATISGCVLFDEPFAVSLFEGMYLYMHDQYHSMIIT